MRLYRFSPNCRRLTPGPGYLEALTEVNVNFIRTPIERFTKTGILITYGVERKVDAVICCTGANTDMRPPFLITASSLDLRDVWNPDPLSYLGIAAPYFPNLLFLQGLQLAIAERSKSSQNTGYVHRKAPPDSLSTRD
jgi:cation diffusion facilitator CzcD-associated flavoprotein CzcO